MVNDVLVMQEKWLRLIGISPGSVKMNFALWFSFIHPDDRQTAIDLVNGCLQGKIENFQALYRIRKPDGQWIWLVDRGKVIAQDDKGSPLRFVGYQSNVSHLKETERLLFDANTELEHRLNFELVINEIADKFISISLRDVDAAMEEGLGKIGSILGVDRSYIFLIDYEKGTMTNTHEWCNEGIKSEKEVLVDMPLEALPWWVNTLKQNKIIDFTDVRQIPDAGAAEREALVSQSIRSVLIAPLFKKETLIGFAGFDAVRGQRTWSKTDKLFLRSFASTMVSVFIFKETQEELERYRNMLQSVLEEKTFELEEKDALLIQKEKELKTVWNAVHNSANGILITDSERKIIYYNKAFCNYTGYDEQELIGKTPSVLSSGANSSKEYEDLYSALKSGNTWKGQFINKRKNGQMYVEENVITPIFDYRGDLINYIAIKQDITKEQRFSQESQRNKRLRALGTLASGIAHDFNNILQIIQSYAELMSVSPDGGKYNPAYLENVLSATQKGKKLIESILTFSRQDSKPLELTDITALTMRTLNIIKPVYKDRIVLISSVHDCGKIPLNAMQYQQMLINLIDNSADAVSDNRRVMISLSRKLVKWDDTELPVNVVELSVTDFGYGMSKETLDRVFEPFFTTKPVGEGTGLGMPMVKGVVDNHKGRIFIESAPGQGTTITVCLPI